VSTPMADIMFIVWQQLTAPQHIQEETGNTSFWTVKLSVVADTQCVIWAQSTNVSIYLLYCVNTCFRRFIGMVTAINWMALDGSRPHQTLSESDSAVLEQVALLLPWIPLSSSSTHIF